MFRYYSIATTQSMPPSSCPLFAFHGFILIVLASGDWDGIGWAYLLWRIQEHRHSTHYGVRLSRVHTVQYYWIVWEHG